jgi:hypothetical protein
LIALSAAPLAHADGLDARVASAEPSLPAPLVGPSALPAALEPAAQVVPTHGHSGARRPLTNSQRSDIAQGIVFGTFIFGMVPTGLIMFLTGGPAGSPVSTTGAVLTLTGTIGYLPVSLGVRAYFESLPAPSSSPGASASSVRWAGAAVQPLTGGLAMTTAFTF